MAEPTFSETMVVPELSESDRIRERIQNFKSQLNPQVLGVITMMLDNQMKSGMIKPADLDAVVVLRDEINKAQIEYNTQIQNAQKRLQDLAEQEQAELVAKQEAAVQAIRDSETQERQRRKTAEERLSNMEAVLLSHGISMDLNNDGVVGLQKGTTATPLTATEQAQVDAMVQVDKDNIATAPVQPTPAVDKAPSRAFQMARFMNPEPEVSTSEETWTEPNPEWSPSGTTTESFMDEVAKVEEVAKAEAELSESETMQADLEPISNRETLERSADFQEKVDDARASFKEWAEQNVETVSEDVQSTEEETTTRTPIADGVYVEEREVVEPTAPSAPVISNSQRPTEPSLDIGYETPKETITTYDTEEDMLAAAQEKIDNAPVVEEEEYEEVTIPSESELKAMTKTGILAQGTMLDFKLDIKDTKAVMIASFLTQVDEFISSLQESGEFVSAESEEGENDNPDIQDGGYF
jgi:hypothetical protein